MQVIIVFISHSCFAHLLGELLTNLEGFFEISWTSHGQQLLACIQLHAVWEITVKAGFRILAFNAVCISLCFAIADASSLSMNLKELYVCISAIKIMAVGFLESSFYNLSQE